jgi:hypothetical protein
MGQTTGKGGRAPKPRGQLQRPIDLGDLLGPGVMRDQSQIHCVTHGEPVEPFIETEEHGADAGQIRGRGEVGDRQEAVTVKLGDLVGRQRILSDSRPSVGGHRHLYRIVCNSHTAAKPGRGA